MFNLLPENKKKIIVREYYLRILILLLLALFFTGVVVSFFLIPSFLAVGAREASSDQHLKELQRKTPELRNAKELEEMALAIKKKLEILKPQSVLLPSQAVNKIIENQPEGVFITGISYSFKGDEVSMSVSGRANTRENLTTFGRSLRGSENFHEVNLPVSDLAKDRDINFSITLSVKL